MKQSRFLISLAIIAVIVIVVFIGQAFYHSSVATRLISTFSECAKLYPVLESYPEQCNTPDGQHFVKEEKVVVPPASSGTDGRVAAGYISGTVTIGPNCPVEHIDHPCKTPPEAFTSREVLVYESDKVTVREHIHLNPDGTYKVAIGPGNYFVQIAPAGIGPGEMKPVTVVSFETITMNFDIDTGIR
jgi:hypothetical protein